MHCISFCIKLDTMVILFSIFIATTCTGTSTSIIAVVCSYVCLCLVKFLVSDKFLFLSLISSWIIVFFFNYSTILFAIRHEPLSSLSNGFISISVILWFGAVENWQYCCSVLCSVALLMLSLNGFTIIIFPLKSRQRFSNH